MRTCTVTGCKQDHRAKGFCATHYGHLLKYGEIRPICRIRGGANKGKVKERFPCAVIHCERDAMVKGFCRLHYNRYRIHGDPSVNYLRKYRAPKQLHLENIARPEKGYFTNIEEREMVRELLQDTLSVHELENCY